MSIIAKKENEEKLKKEKKHTQIRLLLGGIILTIGFIVVVINLSYIIFVKGTEYKQAAYEQQTTSEVISPNRGNIYDTNGEVLAVSVSVDTVSVNPGKVKYGTDEEVENEVLAEKFAELFDITYEEAMEKLESDSSVVVIAKKVEADSINALEEWMEENNITSGINIDEDSKRYYPNRKFSFNITWILRNR